MLTRLLGRARHDYDLAVVGLGSGGIVAARFAGRLGLRVAAIDRARIGGDCLWTGCVPSKALIASAKVAHHARTADRWGVSTGEVGVDLRAVWRRIDAVQAEIGGSDDSAESFQRAGIDVLLGEAAFDGPHSIRVGGKSLTARFLLVCTGSRPAVPAIPGLDEQGYLTSETLWELEAPPPSMVVLGGGPIGCELAQALQRLGVAVTLLQRAPRLLPREEPVLSEMLHDVLVAEGVDVRTGVDIRRVEPAQAGVGVRIAGPDGESDIAAGAILVAAGRRPNVEGLGLERVGVEVGPGGIRVDGRLRTAVRSIYAAGDVAGRYLFTHSAGHEAAVAVRNMFFPGASKPAALVPWCTFTDPELARAGMTEAEAIARHGAGAVRVWELGLEHSDRARTDGATAGSIRVVEARGRIVGAHALAPSAGELIGELALAIEERMPLARLGALVHPYPTIATSVNMLGARSAFAKAERFGFLVRRVGSPR